jgi:hypothetical protein
MTLNLDAIFGTDPGDNLVVAPVVAAVDIPVVAPEPVVIKPRPIIEGTEHFSIWVHDPDGNWPTFVPGYHYDIRQPSRLRGLLAADRMQRREF